MTPNVEILMPNPTESHELYVSTDVETDGPIPGPQAMLSFGSAAFSPDGRLLGTFAANLRTLAEAYGQGELFCRMLSASRERGTA
jgi:hypothetical protein